MSLCNKFSIIFVLTIQMRRWVSIFCLLFPVFAMAQKSSDSVEIVVNVGDSIEIGSCKGDHFQHLDYFRKTRFIKTEKPYDTASGDGFYASFFTSGDFDMFELPASYKGKTFVVLGLEVLSNKKTGNPMHVMYLKGSDPNSIIWVDFYEAVESAEIKFVGYR